MSEYIIKNGHVFDPTQGIKGDKKDIAVKDDKIVDKVGSSAKVIDASGKTVMAGALEIHAHVAGPKVNAGRWYRPEDKHFDSHKTPGITRIEGGKSIPTVFKTGYDVRPHGVHVRHGGGNAPPVCPPRPRGDPRHPHHR